MDKKESYEKGPPNDQSRIPCEVSKEETTLKKSKRHWKIKYFYEDTVVKPVHLDHLCCALLYHQSYQLMVVGQMQTQYPTLSECRQVPFISTLREMSWAAEFDPSNVINLYMWHFMNPVVLKELSRDNKMTIYSLYKDT